MKLSKSLAMATAVASLLISGLAVADVPPTILQPSPEQLRLAHQVVQATGVAVNLVTMFRVGLKDQQLQLNATESGDQKRIDEVLLKFTEERNVAHIPEMLKVADEIYASECTESELLDLANFYQGRTGQMFIEKLPQWATQIVMNITAGGTGEPSWESESEALRLALLKMVREKAPNIFTSDQLKEIANFVRSPAGQAMARKQSEVFKKIVADIQPIMNRINHERMERWCDLAHCTPYMRTWIDHPELEGVPEKRPK